MPVRGRGGSRRWAALFLCLAVAMGFTTQSAWAFAGQAAAAALNTPKQRSDSASGRSHRVAVDATTRKPGADGGNHKPAAGELPAAQLAGQQSSGLQAGQQSRSVPAQVVAAPAKQQQADQQAARARTDLAFHAAGANTDGGPGDPNHALTGSAQGAGAPATTLQVPAAAGNEVVAARTATSSTYVNPDGTKTTRYYPRPVHFQKSDGSWADIDTGLTQGTDGRWVEKANNQPVTFGQSADSAKLVDVPLDASHDVSYSLQGAQPVAGKASGDTLIYAGVASSTDLQYNALATGAKETLILHDASAPTVWTFPLQLSGLSALLDKVGNATFTDSSGKVWLTIPHGSMEDSGIDPHSDQGALSDAVTYQLTTVNGAPALQMTLDSTWLHDPHRVFPVRVDPTTSNVNVSQSTYVMSQFTANYASDSVLKVGTYDGGAHVANSYLYFPGVSSTLGHDYVEGVGLAMDDTWSGSCAAGEVDVSAITTAWNPSSINTYPGVTIGDRLGSSKFAAGTGCPNGTQWENVILGDNPNSEGSQLVGSWAAGAYNYGLAVTASTTDNNAWKQFASVNTSNPPYLYVTYSDWAATSSAPSNVMAPTYNTTGSAQFTMTNVASNWWSPSSMQVKARVLDSNGNEQGVNAPLVGVPGTVPTGQSVSITGVIPILPKLGTAYSVCFDGYVNGTTSLHDSYGVPWQFCVSITGQDTAPQVDAMTPLSNSVLGTLTPTLAATGHDPDNYPGTGLTYYFAVYNAAGTQIAGVNAISSQSWAVPSGVLSWNTPYSWAAGVNDGQVGTWSSVRYGFTTAVQQPPITSHLGSTADDGKGHAFDPQVGNYTTSATDVQVKAIGPALTVTRAYNSLDPRTNLLFGAGWSSAFDMRVQPDNDGSNSVVLTDAAGRAERLGQSQPGSTTYTPAAGEYETLTVQASGGFVLMTKAGTQYTFGTLVNNTWYALSQVKDASGHLQNLTYNTSGQLSTVTDAVSGRALHFTWTTVAGHQHVASVYTDPVSGTDWTTALTWTYTYNSANPDELDQVCAPATGGNTMGSCTKYAYTAGSHLRSATLDAGPASYWRLSDATGTNAVSEAIANEGNDTAHYSATGVTLGAAGPSTVASVTGATFDGSSGVVTLPAAQQDMSSYVSVSLWFKTTASGVLYSYQASPFTTATTPGNYTPALYVGTSGKLHGEFYQGSAASPIASTNAVNDGKWHLAVLAAAGASQTLYLDGAAQGTLNGAVMAGGQHADYVGGGFIGGWWPDEPFNNTSDNTGHANYFNGSIADVAFYNRTMGAPAVSSLWAAGTQASTELTGLTLPSGKTKLAVTYDQAKDRATQLTDANGGVWKIGSPSVSGSAQEYRGQVLGSDPSGFWRLSDSGLQAYNDVYTPRPVPANGTYTNVTLGAAGPMTGSAGAASFDGATSSVQLPTSLIPVQGTAAIALWFKTTGTGTMMGYQSTPLDAPQAAGSAAWNPALYVGTDGKLHAELWNGSVDPMTSSGVVNDGKWHFAVLSADTTLSQTLYVDGQLSAGPLSGQVAPNGTQYLYLGAGNADGWPSAATTAFGHFNGQIANAAVFPRGIPAGTVTALYNQAQSQTAAQGVTAAQPSAYDTAVISAHPLGYWRLDDASGNQATELLSSAALAQNRGTEANTTTGTQAGPWASGTATATTFNGTSSYVQLPVTAVPVPNGNTSVALWFKTGGPGVLYAYQNFPIGASPVAWNPTLYVGSDSKLHGAFAATNTPTVSATTVTDNNWHYAVLTVVGNTEQLYLDGTPSGSAITLAPTYNGAGYAYLGAGTIGAPWPSPPTDTGGHLNGSLADFAIYRYALAASTIQNQYQAATTSSSGTGLDAASAFRTQVVQDVASGYWRLDDPSGAAYAQDELGTALPDSTSSGTYTNATLGTTGPSGDSSQTSATFNGSSTSIQMPAGTAPTQGAATIEMWFKATSGSSGVLYGYQDFPLGAAHTSGTNAWNPALYVGTDGKLHGQFWMGSPGSAMTSASTVNDGQWHQVVLAADGTGQTMYLDGTQTATDTSGHQLTWNGTPYVYIGAGTNDGWPSAGSANFNGSIADVSYYPSRLTSTTVSGHYTAMRNGANPIAVTSVTVTDPSGNTLRDGYDARTAKPVSYTDAWGNTTNYTYDTNGFLYTVTDPDGHTVTIGHDARGNAVSRTTCQNPSNCHTSYATYYLDTSNPLDVLNDTMTSSSDARSSGPSDTTYTTKYTYNSAGQLTSTTTPATPDFPKGRVSYTSYTAGTEAATTTGTEPAGLPAATTNTVDANADTTASAVPANQQITDRYDAQGNLTQTVSQLGLTTTYTYDNIGRALTRTEACTNCGQGQTATTAATSYTWDGQGNPLTETAPATTDAVTGTVHTPQTTWAYDVDGDRTAQTVSDTTGGDKPRTTTWAYNTANDLLAQTTDPAGRKTSYTYDSYGNTVSKTDPAGTNYQYSYAPQGWLQQTAVSNYTGGSSTPVAAHWQVVDSRAYDPAGRLATDTDAMGRITHTYYNDDNTVSEIDLDGFHNFNPTTEQFDGTTRNVVLQSNTYDAAGQLTQRVTGGGKTTVINTYDAAARAVSTTLDPGGLNRVSTQTYDATGDVLTSKLTDGTTTRENDATYDTAGNVLSESVVNTPQNSVTTHTYDQRGLQLTTVSPNGNVSGATPANYTTSYFHDPAGQLAITDAPPVATTVFNTSTGQPVTLPTAIPESRTGYNTFGEAAETKNPDGNITTATHTFDSAGEHLSVAQNTYTTPDGTTTFTAVAQTDYDAMGRPAKLTDPKGNVTSNTYDQLGDLVQVTKPAVGGVTPLEQGTYDLDGELLSHTDPTGAQTQATYDDLGRPITATAVVRQPTTVADTTTHGYDDADNVTTTVDAKGQKSTATYDAAGEALSQTDAVDNTTRFAYNLAGEKSQMTRADGSGETFTADGAGHITATSVLDRDGKTQLATTGAAYDAAGNTISATDANGHTTTYAFDALNRLAQQVQPVASGSSITTSFGYDAAGNRTRYSHTRAAGGSSADIFYTYNTLGLSESVIDPSTTSYPNLADRTYTTAYDADGEPVSELQPGGVLKNNSYDADGRLVTQSGSGAEATTATRTFGYDLAGRLTSAAAGSTSNTYTYDDRGSVITQAGTGGTANFSYDANGNLASRTDKAGNATFGYDADNRLSSMTEPLTGVQKTYQYDSVGNLTSTGYGTGAAVRSFSYDGRERLVSDTLKNPSGTVEASISYGYDAVGNLTSKTTTGFAGSGANTYAYDWANRLTSWTSPTSTTVYAYDNDGNLTQSGQTTTAYDDRDRRVSSGGTTYTYDARGALTGTTLNGTTTSCTYDAFDQQATNGTSNYTFDALGRLATAGSAAFSYDRVSDNITFDGTQTYDRDPSGSLVALGSSAGAALAFNDQHHDLVGTFTASGSALSGSTTYDPWGVNLASAGTTSPVGYQGGWTDPATKLVNTASRWYSPVAGSFTSRDTLTLAPTTAAHSNRYGYADGNPLAGTDPSGHEDDAALATGGGDFGPAMDGETGGPEGGGGGGGEGGDGGDSGDGGDGGHNSYDEEATDAHEAERNQREESEQDAEYAEEQTNTRAKVNNGDSGTDDPAVIDDSTGPSGDTYDSSSQGSRGDHGTSEPQAPTAQEGVNETPGNARPEGNGTPDASANNTLSKPTELESANQPGDSPANPVHVEVESNPAADAPTMKAQSEPAENATDVADTPYDGVAGAAPAVGHGAGGDEGPVALPAGGSTATDVRNSGGVASGGERLANVTGRWLRGSTGNAGRIPGQIAAALRGQSFNSWKGFRAAFWEAVGNDRGLASQFNPGNRALMLRGRAPWTVDTQWYRGGTTYVLHHITPIWDGGGVYDLDNLLVTTPRLHAEILDPAYHYDQ